jgi:hypothetical protein
MLYQYAFDMENVQEGCIPIKYLWGSESADNSQVKAVYTGKEGMRH